MKNHLSLACGSALALCAGAVQAAPVTASGESGSMNVTATVTTACTDLTVNDLGFGSNAQSNADITATTTISVTCGSGVPFRVEMDYGQTPQGTIRTLSTGGVGSPQIDYTLYQPDVTGAGSTTSGEWGPEADGKEYNGTGTGAALPLTVTGVMALTSGAEPGAYSDLVTVTLNFD
jgi:spore coat protein U-like protein